MKEADPHRFYHDRFLKKAQRNSGKPRLMHGKVGWSSPSNIALVKYWGKCGDQIACNPSLSFSLDLSRTKTEIEYEYSSNDSGPSIDFFFEKDSKPDFEQRISKYLNRILPYFPFLKNFHLRISSENTFPHSSGIASSASSMSALALCICSMEQQIVGSVSSQSDFKKKASFMARLGSGSASRSVWDNFAVWGRTEVVFRSSDEIAVPLPFKVSPVFSNLKDSVLIVDDGPKIISSSSGHALMNDHPFAETRYQVARSNLNSMVRCLENGSYDEFVELVESEALMLHGLIVSSEGGYILIKPETLEIIEKIRWIRTNKGIPVCFTLDAGANVHLLYPEKHSRKVRKIVETELTDYCKNGQWIDDGMGSGPREITNR